MDRFAKGWYSEKETMSPGFFPSIKVKNIILQEKTKYQNLEIFESENFGKVLVLDGMIQVVEHDEFSYQEMLCHLAMFSHPNPEKVLIIGGGDGGIAREVLRHNSVKSLVLVDIDEGVINASKIHLPNLSNGAFNNPKMTTLIQDGFEYLKNNKNSFDVIITDSSDPVGPAESLFQEEFYRLMQGSLTENGIISCQGESMWYHLEIIKNTLKFCKDIFENVEYAYTTIPTYPSGQIGFILCSKSKKNVIDFKNPIRKPDENLQKILKYYNNDIHKASFCLPQFVKNALSEYL